MKKKKSIQYRQGDVLLERIDSIPANAKKNKSNLLVLGEASNHGHFIFGADVMAVNEELFIDVKLKAELKHLNIDTMEQTPDHLPIEIPEGKYRVINQREYDPYEKTVNRLMD